MNLLLTFPPEIARAFAAGDPPPAGLSEAEKAAYEQRKVLNPIGYLIMQARRPQTIGTALAESPVGLAAWLLDHDPHSYEQSHTPLQDTPRAPLRETRSSTTSRSIGSPTPGPPPRGSTGRRRAPSTRARFPFPRPSRFSPVSSIARHGVGLSARSRTSSTSMRSTRAATSPRGSSRSCSLKKSERRSDRCGSRI